LAFVQHKTPGERVKKQFSLIIISTCCMPKCFRLFKEWDKDSLSVRERKKGSKRDGNKLRLRAAAATTTVCNNADEEV